MRWMILLAVGLVVIGCEKKTQTKTATGGDPDRGRAIYLSNCVACHNIDPSKDGSIGPAIKGAYPMLLEAKVLTGKYPPGHTPKRKTQAMPVYAYLKSEIRHLEAYLAADSAKPSR